MRRFELTNEQIELLVRLYAEEPIIKELMNCKNGDEFVVSVDLKIDLMDFVEDMYVLDGIDENYEPTSDGYIIESIRDSIYYQTYYTEDEK